VPKHGLAVALHVFVEPNARVLQALGDSAIDDFGVAQQATADSAQVRREREQTREPEQPVFFTLVATASAGSPAQRRSVRRRITNPRRRKATKKRHNAGRRACLEEGLQIAGRNGTVRQSTLSLSHFPVSSPFTALSHIFNQIAFTSLFLITVSGIRKGKTRS
jgi:hypothetical protein